MKENIILSENWELKKIEPIDKISAADFGEDTKDWLTVSKMPAQVQDILLEHKLLPEEILDGWCEKSLWIADFDWVYRCKFKMDAVENARVILEGLDTYADVYVNEQLVVQHDNFFLLGEADLTDILKEENIMLIHFHRVSDYLERLPLPKEWEGAMPHCKMIRKPVHDFLADNVSWGSNYQGAVPGFTPVGVYRKIFIQKYEPTEITEANIRTQVDANYNGKIEVALEGTSDSPNIKICCQLYDEQGQEAIKKTFTVDNSDGQLWKIQKRIAVDSPNLWYPRGFGKPSLYRFVVSVFVKGEMVDSWDKRIGFKRVEIPSPLEFIINGKRVRLWGGSLDPLQGYTHCFIPDRAKRLYDMIENANFNLLRIWGEGIPNPDEFYEYADERGILIWQEFFLGHGAVPDTEKYCEKYKEEATLLVKRLRHRASLLMWCGGNETIMGAEFYGFKPFGKQILMEEFPKVVKELDPGRYYHPSSPSGGEWANDPRVGDYHTYDGVWEYPYKDYPNFISEHIRTSPPVLHSLKRIIKGNVWEAGYQGKQEYDDEFIMPKNWLERSHLGANGQRKSGAFWEYYDASTPEDMIYRFAASYGQEIRRYGEQIRRGSRTPVESGKRSKGYLTCKLLDTWPKIYCSTIDFYQEGFIPYYSVGRLFSPVMLSFAKEESIRLWVVNDSCEDISGTLSVGIYNPANDEFVRKDELAVEVGQGDAIEAFDLAQYNFFSKDCILYAELTNKDGKCIQQCIDFVDIERHLKFPDAKLKVTVEGDELVIESNHLVRCIEILGKNKENKFGWLFSDNYFDLMPGRPRRIRVVAGDEGQLSVKGHYMKEVQTVEYKRA